MLIPSRSISSSFNPALAALAIALPLALASCSGSQSLEGTYRDNAGNTFEVIKGGTAILKGEGKQLVFKWEQLGEDRLKLTPGQNVVFNGSDEDQICNFNFPDAKSLYVGGCPIMKNVRMTRM
ncbi:hypothetical protein [Rhizobium paknamense]|uniref:Lipoprotein n=1 Tax=Rhizobium paknamense TaxID=1206817 RepID=A0ABU0IJ53_9HYPH|nr:hypothetical protein [Rhizobium paknamense]MDQ0458283.1 hypothetical protein [Rhizobium paknamense]